MGQEAMCAARYLGQVSEGRAQLEGDHVLFRGSFRVKVILAELTSVDETGGELRLVWPDGELTLEGLGDLAGRWADRIRNPRTLMDKLGVKPDSRVTVLGVEDAAFLHQLRARTQDVTAEGDVLADSDLIFLRADHVRDLDALTMLQRVIKRNGGIWAVSPKGDPSIRDVDVMAAAKAQGLVDVKLVAFSATHTALKLVIPKALR